MILVSSSLHTKHEGEIRLEEGECACCDQNDGDRDKDRAESARSPVQTARYDALEAQEASVDAMSGSGDHRAQLRHDSGRKKAKAKDPHEMIRILGIHDATENHGR